MKKTLIAKNDTIDYQEHENIEYIIDETSLYDIDKLSLGGSHKEWRKRESVRELEIIYDMKRLNYMNFIHDNKINNISE